MHPHPFRLTGFARGSHVEVVAHARDAVCASGGTVLDYHMFSNAILCLTIEIAPANLGPLAAALAAAGVRLDEQSLAQVEPPAALGGSEVVERDGRRVEGTLSINLVHGEPPLRIEVPAVPG